MSKPLVALPGKPAKVDIVHKRNDTYKDSFRGFKKDGTPYDFTGASFLMQIKKDPDDKYADLIVEIPDTSFTITQDSLGSAAGVSNIIKINHTDADFDTFFEDYYYDIQVTLASGEVRTIFEGSFSVTRDTSRPAP